MKILKIADTTLLYIFPPNIPFLSVKSLKIEDVGGLIRQNKTYQKLIGSIQIQVLYPY